MRREVHTLAACCYCFHTVSAHVDKVVSLFLLCVSTLRQRVMCLLIQMFFSQVRFLSKSVVTRASSAHKCALAHEQECVVCLSLSCCHKGRGLTFTSAHVLVRAPFDGPSSQTHRYRGPKSGSGPCSHAPFGRVAAARVSSPGDWAVSTDSHVQWNAGASHAPPSEPYPSSWSYVEH